MFRTAWETRKPSSAFSQLKQSSCTTGFFNWTEADIEKLFHKLFPNNEYHLVSVRTIITTAHKNFQKLKQNKKKSLEDIKLFLDTDREVDVVYLGPNSKQAGVTKYSVINNVVKPISCEFISNGLIAELLNVKTVSEKTIFNIVNRLCNGQFSATRRVKRSGDVTIKH